MMQESSAKSRQKCEVYSRVVGYLSPVHRWNKGKQQEFHNRKVFKV
jgi:anaerobic ribonucleoside-triphosphate reductase